LGEDPAKQTDDLLLDRLDGVGALHPEDQRSAAT
jgi:hypothetical protein